MTDDEPVAMGRKEDMFPGTRRNAHCKKNGLEDNK